MILSLQDWEMIHSALLTVATGLNIDGNAVENNEIRNTLFARSNAVSTLASRINNEIIKDFK